MSHDIEPFNNPKNPHSASHDVPYRRSAAMGVAANRRAWYKEMTDNTTHVNITLMVEELVKNVALVQYGEVSLCLKIHDGRIVSTTHSLTKNSIKKEEKSNS